MSSKHNNYASSAVTVGTTETQLLARNNNRTGLVMYNQGGADVKFYFDDNSTAYFVLKDGEGMHLPAAPQNEINAIVDSGSVVVSVLEC